MENELDIVNLVVNYDLGWGELTNSSSWIDQNAATITDLTFFSFLGGEPFFNDNVVVDEVFTEELRLSSKFDGALQFVAGLYYEDRDQTFIGPWIWSGDPTMDPFAAPSLPKNLFKGVLNIEQYAFFGELSYAMTDQLTATVGGRYFDYEKKRFASSTFNGVVNYVDRPVAIEESDQSYMVNLSYTPNDDALVYARWAQGFRLGDGQTQTGTCDAVGFTRPAIKSDTSENIEFGIKMSLADNRVILNAALFHADWDDLPVTLLDPCIHTQNAGKAQSEGIELELQAALTENLHLDMSASYTEATLQADSSLGSKGDNLPGSADYNLSLGAQYDFTLANYNSFARIDYAYIGEYYNKIGDEGMAAGGFGQLHLKAGIEIGQITADVFAKNLTNENSLTWVETIGTSFGTDGVRAYRIRPRTIGINLNYRF